MSKDKNESGNLVIKIIYLVVICGLVIFTFIQSGQIADLMDLRDKVGEKQSEIERVNTPYYDVYGGYSEWYYDEIQPDSGSVEKRLSRYWKRIAILETKSESQEYQIQLLAYRDSLLWDYLGLEIDTIPCTMEPEKIIVKQKGGK